MEILIAIVAFSFVLRVDFETILQLVVVIPCLLTGEPFSRAGCGMVRDPIND